jgi:hypothetical protein
LETGVSGFCGFNPNRGKTYPFTLILSQLSRTPGGEAPRPLGGKFLDSSVESLDS